jgi:hypothetical protein
MTSSSPTAAGGTPDPGVLQQGLLDLLGRNVLPPAADDVLEPVDEGDEPFGVDDPLIPGVQPPAAPEGGRGLCVLGILDRPILLQLP